MVPIPSIWVEPGTLSVGTGTEDSPCHPPLFVAFVNFSPLPVIWENELTAQLLFWPFDLCLSFLCFVLAALLILLLLLLMPFLLVAILRIFGGNAEGIKEKASA